MAILSATTPVTVTVHPSQFPDAVQRELIESLRSGEVPPKFLYDSVRQTQKWLEVHQAHSPARTGLDVEQIYDVAFDDALGQAQSEAVAWIGLGCGGGRKDTRGLAKPAIILPRLAGLLREDDQLLFSANLAPGGDYRTGVEAVMPQYDNAETRAWLLSFLLGIGVPETAGELVFEIEEVGGLLRIVADFKFGQPQSVTVAGEAVAFRAGQSLRLFYSYRRVRPVALPRWRRNRP